MCGLGGSETNKSSSSVKLKKLQLYLDVGLDGEYGVWWEED
jgi:hypothetical protein